VRGTFCLPRRLDQVFKVNCSKGARGLEIFMFGATIHNVLLMIYVCLA